MKIFYTLCLMFCCSLIYCQPDADFIRGDFNGDGTVNNTDLVSMGNWLSDTNNYPGPASPADRADVNDDGIVDISDLGALGNFLFGGGAAPASPYPAEGHDCTGDDLAPCTSPGPGSLTPTLTNDSIDATLSCGAGIPEWDHFQQGVWSGSEGACQFYYKNYASCVRESTCNKGFATWTVNDEVTFTETELEQDVLDVFVKQQFSHEFLATTYCGACPSNDILSYTAKVLVDVSAGGPSVVVDPNISWSADVNYCGGVDSDDTITITKNITQDILDAIQPGTGDCDEWSIVRYTVLVTVNFGASGGDTAIHESVTLDLDGEVYYTCSE